MTEMCKSIYPAWPKPNVWYNVLLTGAAAHWGDQRSGKSNNRNKERTAVKYKAFDYRHCERTSCTDVISQSMFYIAFYTFLLAELFQI